MQSESNTRSCDLETHQCWKLGLFHIIMEWKSIQYFAYSLEVPLSRTAKPSTYVNRGFDKIRTRTPLINSGENYFDYRFGYADLSA